MVVNWCHHSESENQRETATKKQFIMFKVQLWSWEKWSLSSGIGRRISSWRLSCLRCWCCVSFVFVNGFFLLAMHSTIYHFDQRDYMPLCVPQRSRKVWQKLTNDWWSSTLHLLNANHFVRIIHSLLERVRETITNEFAKRMRRCERRREYPRNNIICVWHNMSAQPIVRFVYKIR